MDAGRFDRLTRSLTAMASRRGIARLLSAGTLGGLLAARGVGEASAHLCARWSAGCDAHRDCCTRLCAGGLCACRETGQRCRRYENCCDVRNGCLEDAQGVRRCSPQV